MNECSVIRGRYPRLSVRFRGSIAARSRKSVCSGSPISYLVVMRHRHLEPFREVIEAPDADHSAIGLQEAVGLQLPDRPADTSAITIPRLLPGNVKTS